MTHTRNDCPAVLNPKMGQCICNIRMYTNVQPAPQGNASTPVWDLVIADMRNRDQAGRRKYGVPLQANNGRDQLQDAYEEALDLVVYLRAAIEERKRADKIAYWGDHDSMDGGPNPHSYSPSNHTCRICQAITVGWQTAAEKIQDICAEFNNDPKACLTILGEVFGS